MSLRVCSQPGCGELIPKTGRCPVHERATDRARGTTSHRGYGHEHQQARKQWTDLVATGTIDCARCGETIEPNAPWHLDHDDEDRTRYLGPSCATCNLSAAGKARHR